MPKARSLCSSQTFLEAPVPSWVCLELVEASPGTEAVPVALMHFRVTLIRGDWYAAYGIDSVAHSAVSATSVPMDHVSAAAEAHHEVEETGKHQQRKEAFHVCDSSV
jgi:hypothetical protein